MVIKKAFARAINDTVNGISMIKDGEEWPSYAGIQALINIGLACPAPGAALPVLP